MLSKCFCRREWGALPPAVFYSYFRQVQGKMQRRVRAAGRFALLVSCNWNEETKQANDTVQRSSPGHVLPQRDRTLDGVPIFLWLSCTLSFLLSQLSRASEEIQLSMYSNLSYALVYVICHIGNTSKRNLSTLECFQLSHWAASFTTPSPCCWTSGSKWSLDTTIWTTLVSRLSKSYISVIIGIFIFRMTRPHVMLLWFRESIH